MPLNIKCIICNREFKNILSLTRHIRHNNISSKIYYDTYIKKQDENKIYYFDNITKDSDVKGSLHNVQVQDNFYIYEA